MRNKEIKEATGIIPPTVSKPSIGGKELSVLILVFSLCATLLTGCGGKRQNAVSGTFGVSKDEEFGSVFLDVSVEDFEALGFTCGDSVNVEFDNGFSLMDVPYHDGYYVATNEPVVVAYPGYQCVFIAYSSGESLWEDSGCSEGDSVTITLAEKGKYRDNQETMSSVYSMDRNDYASDEAFSNFRAVECKNLRQNTFYRGASPVNDTNNRASLTDSLIKEAGIRFVLDLADNDKKLEGYMEDGDPYSDSPYFMSLYEEGNVVLVGLNMAYRSDSFCTSLADGFREMMKHEGPYYIHCTEGKDRTGFVCMIIEALAGADYADIERDYMITYDNYYGITSESSSEKYDALKEIRLHDMLLWLANSGEGTDLSKIDFRQPAEDYLRRGGMSEAEIDEFRTFLTE